MANREIAEGVKKEKNLKLLEVSKSLCNQLTESLGSVEVAGQPCQVQ